MSKFNYTDLHFFDKRGIELPITYNSNCIAEIINEYGDNAVFYGLKDCSTGEFEFIKKKSGNRFTNRNVETCDLTIGDTTYRIEKTPVSTKQIISSNGNTYYIDELKKDDITLVSDEYDLNEKLDALPFPTVTLSSSLSIAPVSVDLVETQSIYVLCKDADGNFVKLEDYGGDGAFDFKDHYKLLLYINKREQEDFRFFKVNNSTLTWTDKIVMDFNKGDFKANIGFCAKEEGIYEEILYICLLKDVDLSDPNSGEIYPIGSINLQAEAIGEDERYRTLFTNFGIPDPIKYQEVFANTTLEEGKMDYVKLNENSKKLFLTYSEIFPYVGTYKALINAVNVLGYHDVFFKEWYKEIGKVIPGQGYVAYDMYYKSDPNANTINNVPVEERISLRKLNWLSMIYRINKELVNEAEDQWGFPQTIEVYDYNDEEIITKLYSLKKWLEKYILGLNCKIIDVSGEGIYFERYKLDSFGTYQQIFDWDNSKNLIPKVVTVDDELGEPETYYLIDSSSYIKVDVGLYKNGTIEDYKNYTLEQLCKGYIDADGIYHQNIPSSLENDSSCVFVGKTFDCLNDFEEYELKATSYGEDFLFGKDYLTEDSAGLRVHDNKIFFNPFELLEKQQTSIFKVLPFIQLEKANIRKKTANWNNSIKYRINPEIENDTLESYTVKNLETKKTISTVDYVTLVPPTYEEFDSSVLITSFSGIEVELDSVYVPEYRKEPECDPGLTENTNNIKTFGLRYSALNKMHMPLFSIVGYEINGNPDFLDVENEYFLEILDGKMMFDDVENDRKIFLNFNYDNDTDEQEVKISIIYTSDVFRIESYQDEDEVSLFIPGNDYSTFVNNYNTDPETAISYNNIHEIRVMNNGQFTVDVYARDLQNNIFAKNCENFAYVYLPDFSIMTFTNSENSSIDKTISGVIATNYKDFLKYNYQDFCIYNNSYMIDGFKKFIDDDNETLSVKYPTYSYSMHTAGNNDYLHFMNISERFMVDAVEYKINSTLDNTYSSYFLTLEKDSLNYYTRIMEENDSAALLAYRNGYAQAGQSASSYMNDLSSSSKNLSNDFDYMDVNFILYNTLAHYPLLQTYATMLNANAIPYSEEDKDYRYTDGKYRLLINDRSRESYIWASLTEHIKQDIVKLINLYIDSVEDASFGPEGEENVEPPRPDWDNIKVPRLPSFSINSLEKNHYLGYSVIVPEDEGGNIPDEEEDEEEEKDLLEGYYKLAVIPGMFDDIAKKLETHLKESTITISSGEVDNETLGELLSSYKNSLENIINSFDASTCQSYEDASALANYIKTDCNLNNLIYDFDGHSYNLYVDTRYETCKVNSDTLDPLLGRYIEYMISQPEGYDAYIAAEPTDAIDYILGSEEDATHKGLYAGAAGQALYQDLYESERTALASVLSAAKLDETIIEAIVLSIVDGTKVQGNDLAEMFHEFVRSLYDKFESDMKNAVSEINNYSGSFNSVYAELLNCTSDISSTRETIQKIMRNALIDTEISDNDILELNEHFYNQYDKYLFATCAYIGFCTLMNLQRFISYNNDGFNNLYSELLDEWRNEVTIASYANTIKVADGLYGAIFANYGRMDINSALTEEYYREWAEDSYTLYDKLIVNLTQLTADFLQDKWVIKEVFDGNGIFVDILYAVAAPFRTPTEDENEYDDEYAAVEENTQGYDVYYVKPAGNSYEGLLYSHSVDTIKEEGKTIDKHSVKNALPEIENVVDKPYIAAFIQPIWQSQVSISLITPENAVRLGFISKEEDYETIENQYLCVQYSYSDFTWHFRKGEMIKLVFKSLSNNDYVGQSSYEVVGYDTEEQVIIVKGSINAAYVRKEKHEVWAKFPDTQPEYESLSKYKGDNVDEREVTPLIRTYVYNIGDNETASTTYRLPLKKIDGVWYYKVFYFVNGVPRPIETVKIDPQEKVNMYISYAHNAFVDYTMRANSATENANGTTDLQIDYNLLNCRKMQFIDDTFVLYSTDFDVNEGLAAWMNTISLDGSICCAVLGNDVYSYESSNGFVPVEISSSTPNIVFAVNFSDMGLNEEESYVQWKIYRKLPTDNERQFMFESYNRVLYLDYTALGIYDIEANVYDKYGNTQKKIFKGAYKVVENVAKANPTPSKPENEIPIPETTEPQEENSAQFTGTTEEA